MARPAQTAPPGEWTYWLILAGRGFGKTRTGAEWVRASASSGRFEYVNLIGPTADDARDIMIDGESGILAVCPPWERPEYRPSKRRLEWPNGCRSLVFTADEPERLRGKQHQRLWADEPASWRYPDAWDQAMFGLRLGPEPRAVITGTPKPVKLIRELVDHPGCVVTRGTTYENRDNLAAEFYETIIRAYEGRRLGRQELLAEILEDVPGALWRSEWIEEERVAPRQVPELSRVVVAIDPAASVNEDAGSSETGIIVAGFSSHTQRGYVLADRTLYGSPEQWAHAAHLAFLEFEADLIVAEKNNGGDMVKHTIHTANRSLPVKLVSASRGKRTRAEPVSLLYERRLVHHVGVFGELEQQMTTWTPDEPDSPDRMDALVWALTELMVERSDFKQYAAYGAAGPKAIRRGDMILREDVARERGYSYIDE